MNPSELKRIIEALILCHDAPLSLPQIKQSLDIDIANDVLRNFLDEIVIEWKSRAVNLVQVSTGWRFQSAPDLAPYLDRMRAEKPASYSRAVFETLAIIAYRQPVTRGDIEDIRGVTVSSHIIKTLEERGWIDVVGQREVPGRPSLLATTKQFLDDLGLRSLQDLPPLLSQNDPSDETQLTLNGLAEFAQAVENVSTQHQDGESLVLVHVDSADSKDTVVFDDGFIAEDSIEDSAQELDELALLESSNVSYELSDELSSSPSNVKNTITDNDAISTNHHPDSPLK